MRCPVPPPGEGGATRGVKERAQPSPWISWEITAKQLNHLVELHQPRSPPGVKSGLQSQHFFELIYLSWGCRNQQLLPEQLFS